MTVASNKVLTLVPIVVGARRGTECRGEQYLSSEIELATRKIGAQKRKRVRAFDTRALVASDIIGNARKKSDRVSAGLRERTLAAQDAARISSPTRA